MVREYTLEFMIRDDGSVICVNRHHAVMLNRTLAGYVQRLVEEFQPAGKQYATAPPARSFELAKKAPLANGEGDAWKMTKTMVKVLSTVAALSDPVTISDIMTLCEMKRGTASSKLSMLTTNGYLTRVDQGKYMASPAGNAFLVEHSNK